jgi:hypothetical protein
MQLMADRKQGLRVASSTVGSDESRSQGGSGLQRSDMEDTPAELRRWPHLQRALRVCSDVIMPTYLKADEAAIRHQRWHRWLTLAAALSGTITVLAGILQLSHLVSPAWPLWVEVAAALFAVFAVLLGVLSLRQKRWLLERHKAERCRLLKYRFLIDPAIWQSSDDDWGSHVGRLRRDAEAVERLEADRLHHGAEEDLIPDLPKALISPRAVDRPPRDLLDFYQYKRLQLQMAYFARQAERNVRFDRYTRLLPPGLFFVSVAFACLHFVYDLLRATEHGPTPPHDPLSVLLIVAAIAIPVIGACVRTLRTAYEFARNTSRFRAKYVALERLAERLQRENDPAALWYAMWCCEQMMDAEHREWLRLMIEAEWFG